MAVREPRSDRSNGTSNADIIPPIKWLLVDLTHKCATHNTGGSALTRTIHMQPLPLISYTLVAEKLAYYEHVRI
jgi:hypothetical protein